MASVYVLYIGDNFISNSLELMRKICEPSSRSRPHVTVRGPIIKGDIDNNDWKNSGISQLDLLGPGCFFSKDGIVPSQNTVFIKCFSEEIYAIHYKPDYITSRPHITLYDGQSREFAEMLLKKVKLFAWGLRIHLPGKYDKDSSENKYPYLTEIQLKKKKGNKKKEDILINGNLKDIYKKITKRDLTISDLLGFTDTERIELVETIYRYLESSFLDYKENYCGAREEILGEIIDINIVYKEEVSLEIDRHKDIKPERHQLKLFEDFQLKTITSKSQKARNKLGQFPTPPELAVEIAKYVKLIFPDKVTKIDFGDPSIGTGTFFYAFEKVFSSDRILSAYGIEIDKEIAELTNDLWSDHGLNLIFGDFFDQEKLPLRNLILCNPPYIRHQYLSVLKKRQLKDRVFKELDLKISGLASLYAYFMLLSHSWMQPSAIAAWLIPSEFLEVNYGECLRTYLSNKVTTILIHRYDPSKVQFEGVMVTSSVIIFKNENPSENHRIKLSFGGSLFAPEKSEIIDNSNFKNKIKWNRNTLINHGSNDNAFQIKDYFKIMRGIATGANSFFILPKYEAEQLGIPSVFLKPILPGPKKLKSQVINSDQYGYPCIDQQLSLFDCDLPEEYLKEKFPETWKYLDTARQLNLKSRHLIKRRRLWYRQEQREVPLFLCTYFGKEKENLAPLRFIWNKSMAIATNVYLLLYPSNMLQKLLARHPDLQEDVFICLSRISKKTMENGGRVYGGGLYKLEPKELGALPLEGIEDMFKRYF